MNEPWYKKWWIWAIVLVIILAVSCGIIYINKNLLTLGSSKKVVQNVKNKNNSDKKANTNEMVTTDQPAKTTTDSNNSNNNNTSINFAPTIDQAMMYVQKRTNISLMAPTMPIFLPNVPFMSAMAYGEKNSYHVTLYSTDKQLPVNSPVLSSSPFEEIGSFGGMVYPSFEIAKAKLYSQPSQGDIAPSYQTPPNDSSSKINLGNGIIGTQYSGEIPMLEWHEGKWTFQVWDGTLEQDVQVAKNLVTYLDTHLLPPTYGVLGVNIAGDGNHTSAEWVYGNTTYWCISYHSAVQAAEMAVSSRMYPNGKTFQQSISQTPDLNNSFFFKGNASQVNYIGNFSFADVSIEPIQKEIKLFVNELATLKYGRLYELKLDEIEGVPKDRLNLGYFYVKRDKIYRMKPTEENLNKLKATEEVPVDSEIICQEQEIKDSLKENEHGWHKYMKVNGNRREYHSYNNQIETGYYESFTWEFNKGLISYQSGFGAEKDSINLQIKND